MKCFWAWERELTESENEAVMMMIDEEQDGLWYNKCIVCYLE